MDILKRWLMRVSGPEAGTPEYSVQEAYLELGAAGKSGDEDRQDAAWDGMRAAATAARAGDVLYAMSLVEDSHRGGPLSYEDAMHRLTDAVYAFTKT